MVTLRWGDLYCRRRIFTKQLSLCYWCHRHTDTHEGKKKRFVSGGGGGVRLVWFIILDMIGSFKLNSSSGWEIASRIIDTRKPLLSSKLVNPHWIIVISWRASLKLTSFSEASGLIEVNFPFPEQINLHHSWLLSSRDLSALLFATSLKREFAVY